MSCGYRVIADTLASAQTNNVVVLTGLPSWYFIALGLNDLLHAAPAIGKGAAAVGAAIPFTAKPILYDAAPVASFPGDAHKSIIASTASRYAPRSSGF
jgi:hypothetical protein